MFAAPHRVQWLRVDYSHLSTQNEIRNGSEVPFVETTTIPSLASAIDFRLRERRFAQDWGKYIAPCAVANYFNLSGSPFESHDLAILALKNVLRPHAEAENIDVDQYSAEEL